MPVQRMDLMCRVQRLSYDFDAKAGALHMEEGDCCDQNGCTALFKAIDPDVKRIEAWSGRVRDIVYVRTTDGWRSAAV